MQLSKLGLGNRMDLLPPPVAANLNWSQFHACVQLHIYGAISFARPSTRVVPTDTEMMERDWGGGTLCWICPTCGSHHQLVNISPNHVQSSRPHFHLEHIAIICDDTYDNMEIAHKKHLGDIMSHLEF